MPLDVGLRGQATMTVTAEDTAETYRSGDVPVLATPRVIALAEEATVQAVAGHLDGGETSVGVRVQVDHVAATAIDRKVVADATLEQVNGRRLVFTVSVSDGRGLIAAGRVTRVVVDRERFIEKSV